MLTKTAIQMGLQWEAHEIPHKTNVAMRKVRFSRNTSKGRDLAFSCRFVRLFGVRGCGIDARRSGGDRLVLFFISNNVSIW